MSKRKVTIKQTPNGYYTYKVKERDKHHSAWTTIIVGYHPALSEVFRRVEKHLKEHA